MASATPLTSLEEFTPDDLRTLAYASALGREFDFQLLVEAMGVDEEPLAERLEELTHRGVLRERVGGDRFTFVQEELRARVYQSLTVSRLRVLHRKIGEAIERTHPDPPPEWLPELGRHYFLGKVPAKSFEYNRRAAERATAGDDPAAAIQHFERARLDLDALPGGPVGEAAALDERLGDLHFGLGDYAASDQYYTRALAAVEEGDPRLKARLVLARAEIARQSLDHEAATRGATEGLALSESAGDAVGVATARRILSRVAFYRGDYPRALDEAMGAHEALRSTHDLRAMGRLAIDIGNVFSSLGPEYHDLGVEWYGKAIQRLTEVGDWFEASRAHHNLAVLYGESQPQQGLEELARARGDAERAREPRSVAWALVTGVEMQLALGRVEEAHRDNEQASRLLERVGDTFGLEQVARNRGLICEKQGQWDDAERAFLVAIEMAEKTELVPEAAEIYYHLARLRFKTRDAPGARLAFERAAALGLPRLRPSMAKSFLEFGAQLASQEAAPGSG